MTNAQHSQIMERLAVLETEMKNLNTGFNNHLSKHNKHMSMWWDKVLMIGVIVTAQAILMRVV